MLSWVKRRIEILVNEGLTKLYRLYSYLQNHEVVPYVPYVHGIELTNICNLRCTFCNREPMIARGLHNLTPEQFATIVNKCREGLGYVQLYHHGESFVNPHFVKILELARKAGLRTHIVTNVTKVKGKKAVAAVQTFERVCFSFDAPTKEYFEETRLGANYDECVKNIEDFVKLNDKMGHPVRVEINIVITDGVRPYIKDFVDRWGNVVDIIWFTQLVDWGGHKDVSDHGKTRKPKQRMRCGSPWGEVYIMSDGRVYPCCTWEPLDGDSFGNIFEQSLEEIWNGKKYQEFRRKHATGDLSGTFCETCENPWSGGINIVMLPKSYGFKTTVLFFFLHRLKNKLKRFFTRRKHGMRTGWAYKADVYYQTNEELIKNPSFILGLDEPDETISEEVIRT